MRTLMNICEGILNNVEDDIENYVEVLDRMTNDLKWMNGLKQEDAVYFDAALFNITQDAFRKCASSASDEYKHLLAVFMNATLFKYGCVNFEDTENWEEREYDDLSQMRGYRSEVPEEMLEAEPNDYRWKWTGSNSFYHFFWDPDYTHSLDQEDLLVHKKTQTYSKKLQDIASKYGLKLKPIF